MQLARLGKALLGSGIQNHCLFLVKFLQKSLNSDQQVNFRNDYSKDLTINIIKDIDIGMSCAITIKCIKKIS
jgi:hypothetical protein